MRLPVIANAEGGPDPLPWFGPQIMRDNRAVTGGHRRVASAANPLPTEPHSMNCDAAHGGMPLGSNWGQCMHSMLNATGQRSPMNSGSRGGWDRNRIGALRFWSSPRSVHCCWCVYTDAEFYWLLHGGVSSCVHLCRHGLLSKLLSIMQRVLWEFSWPATVSPRKLNER